MKFFIIVDFKDIIVRVENYFERVVFVYKSGVNVRSLRRRKWVLCRGFSCNTFGVMYVFFIFILFECYYVFFYDCMRIF